MQFIIELKNIIPDLKKRYFKQVFIHEHKSGNTVKNYSSECNIPYLNLNLELAKLLQGIQINRRPYKIADYLNQRLNAMTEEIICLDYFELLFEPSLQINPFDLFENISKNKTLIIAWRGNIHDGHFIQAEPGHPEYRVYPTDDALVIK
ncbi:BREX-3 system P-loop-containing protein BrxF [Sporosarcina limicola]|uniref:BREX-3 system P-loop-containing protein BrxF n=1 Tax=Sporosarcina limicola TaxID=34101 RepID=UPI00178B0A28|nr:BREX-3 system P-loop-containing protein BrxF [Sporosarcina limicola]